MKVFYFSCLIYISKSTHAEEEGPATHNGPSGDGEYKTGGWPISESFCDFTNYQIGKAKCRSVGQLLELPFIYNNGTETEEKEKAAGLVRS